MKTICPSVYVPQAFVLCAVLTAWAPVVAQDPVGLLTDAKGAERWEFGNGPEFPGARGSLKVSGEFRGGPVLALHGDFSEGGNYVQAAAPLPDVPIEKLSFWIQPPPGVTSVPIRIIDGTQQCHQLRLKLSDKGGWQRIEIPVEEYFRKMGTAGALDIASQYEKWSGANDGRWHQPGKLFVVLCSRALGEDVRLLLSDVQLQPAREKTSIEQTIRLDDGLDQEETGWLFSLGQEFPGAKGSLEVMKDRPQQGVHGMRIQADFRDGGAYVGIRKSFVGLEAVSMPVIRMKARTTTAKQFAIRMVDGSDQTHQRKALPLVADGRWHDVEIIPDKIAGGEHWGGANDGQWHGMVQLIELMLNVRSHDGQTPSLEIADLRADVVLEATPYAPSWRATFDDQEGLAPWEREGDVQLVAHGDQDQALQLRRTLNQRQQPTMARGPAFAVSPGMWRLSCLAKSSLHSPDNSYHGRVELELYNKSGERIETIPIGIVSGSQAWRSLEQVAGSRTTFEVPNSAVQGKVRVSLSKTYGTLAVDQFEAARLKVQPIEQPIERIMISSSAVGNLFLPGESAEFQVAIRATKPLPSTVIKWSVRDYWGAKQAPATEAQLQQPVREDGAFIYRCALELPIKKLQVGRFYELHVEAPTAGGEPVTEFSGFSILPRAITKEHPAEQVPFTIRNWDSRIPVYFRLADRLGIRMLGVWGGWESSAPHTPHGPGIDLVQALDAKWITGTPASQIERNGFEEYSEASLRSGMKNFLKAYSKAGLAKIAIGNEPHGTGEKVLENVRAYRAIYESAKAVDPGIHVMGTSVEPNEEYFKAGYQNYLDSYDFHIYEHYSNVRKTMREYRALMKKYDAVKPIHSTELGLNSQGQARIAVAREMIKKFVVFFAEGGDTASWFTIQYPDPEGKARGQFGDSHCMFDCKYNLYNPRLDAITHYHLINAICVKKFVAEQHYAGGVQAYLFKDQQGQTLQVLWSDEGRTDVGIPIKADAGVELVRVDGTRQLLFTREDAVSLSLSPDPVMLLYTSSSDAKSTANATTTANANANVAALPKTLGAPLASIRHWPETVTAGDSIAMSVEKANAVDLQLTAPPTWTVESQQAREGSDERFLLRPSATATAREARVRVQIIDEQRRVVGELAAAAPVSAP